MSILANVLDKVTALCVGTTAVALSGGSVGAIEATVGAAGLIGFVIGRKAKFGPESARVRGRIQAEIFADYRLLLSGSDGDLGEDDDLVAASLALDDALTDCIFDRASLAAAAVSERGFPEQAVDVIMSGLAVAAPDFFAPARSATLGFRFARDVVRAGITAAVADADYYRQLEPHLMFEMGRALGSVKADVAVIATKIDGIGVGIDAIRTEYRRELDLAKAQLHATETDLVALLSAILERRVARETLLPALEQSYERLTRLRENSGDLRSLANEVPELAKLLARADDALSAGRGFSLDEAERALGAADARYAALVAERESNLRRDKENRARILGKRAEIAAVRFDYAGATRFYREQLSLLLESLGPDHPDTATSYNSVAYNLNSQGRYGEAEALFCEALEIRERVLGPDHPDTATSYNNVASNLNAQGRYGEAEPLYRKALEIRGRMLGPDHPDTATSYNNVAFNLNAQGRYGEAEPRYRRALEICERVLGPDHPNTAASYNNVASNLNAQGRYGEAEPLYRRALEIRERVLGPDQPTTATSYNNVAYNLNAQGRYGEAEPLYRRALEIRERVLGPDHPDTAGSYNNVAYNLDAQGRYSEAEPLYRRALEIRERVLGPDHPDAATTYNNVAYNLNAQGRYSEAEPLYRKALAIFERVLGPNHPTTAAVRENLARNLKAMGKA